MTIAKTHHSDQKDAGTGGEDHQEPSEVSSPLNGREAFQVGGGWQEGGSWEKLDGEGEGEVQTQEGVGMAKEAVTRSYPPLPHLLPPF